MNAPTPAGTAAHDALAEVCRNQSLQLDAARERIAAAEAERDAALAERDAARRERDSARAILAHYKTSLNEQHNDPMQGDQMEVSE